MKKVIIFLLVFLLSFSTIVYGDQIEDLEAQNYYLETELTDTLYALNEVELLLIQKGEDIEETEHMLADSLEKQEIEYQAMKIRIQFMYENSFELDLDFTDMIKSVELTYQIYTYDRELLNDYIETTNSVTILRNQLLEEQNELLSLREEYTQKTEDLNSYIIENNVTIEELRQAAQEIFDLEQMRSLPTPAAETFNEAPQTFEEIFPIEEIFKQEIFPTIIEEVIEEEIIIEDYSSTGNLSAVERAYLELGKDYEWGACGPDSYDCSGFVAYCLTGIYARLGTTLTFLTWPQVTDPQPGDICTNATHCGLYIGDGQMIHASDYGIGVIIGPVPDTMIYVRY